MIAKIIQTEQKTTGTVVAPKSPAGKSHRWFKQLTPDQLAAFKKDWVNLERFPTLESLLEAYKEAGSVTRLKYFAYRVCRPKLPNRAALQKELLKTQNFTPPAANHNSSCVKAETILQNLPLEDRKWDDPEVLQMAAEDWGRPGGRVGCLSRLDYFSDGFRRGIVVCNCEILVRDGIHFLVINAGLTDKDSFKSLLKQRITEAKEHIKQQKEEAKRRGQKIAAIPAKVISQTARDNLMNEAAQALAAILPRFRKPSMTGADANHAEYIRYYISTSPRYDGPCGEEIARRLQKLRPDDIRCYKAGSARTVVKGVDRTIWSISPVRTRIPGKYFSQAAEKEIEDKQDQTSHPTPDLWAVGCLGSAVYKGEGEREVAYITDPASSRQEKVTIGENQVGTAVVEYVPPDSSLVPGTVERLVRFWSVRDLIANERQFITGIKDGSQRIHHLIVEALKREGALSVGQICDELGTIDRVKVENALKFLEESKASQRKTWPGLCYYPAAQLYDFYLDWIQNKLRYCQPKPGDSREDNLLFTGCLHAGYTTIDYEFIVKQHPVIMQRRRTKILVSLGDEIAGLHHGFQCTGEIFSSLNNTEQERFAAELRAETIYRTFKERFDLFLKDKKIETISIEALRRAIDDALVLFLVIPGNHDLWQEQEGNTPLAMFVTRLQELLVLYLTLFMTEKRISPGLVNLAEIVRSKIKIFPDTEAVLELPSGLKLAMAHPHMGRALTTSLRAQNAIGLHDAQITGIANFHTATVVHKWKHNLGQCVSVQVGTHAIYTRFEKRKMKFKVDFGPIALRTVSHQGRLFMTEVAYYNKPYLKKAIPKSTDINTLRKKLGLRCAELNLPLNIV